MHKEIELKPYMRFDKYPQFTNRINVIAQYDLQINCNSWGLNAAYKIPLAKDLLIKMGKNNATNMKFRMSIVHDKSPPGSL